MANHPKKRVLITGATGYLGGRIALALQETFQITLGVRDPSSLKAVAAFQNFSRIRFDIDDPQTFPHAVADMDVVIHLAALNHQDCEKNPSAAERINVIHTEKLLNDAISAKVSCFLYMSTIHVYGTPLPSRISEKTPPHAQSIYAKTHLAAEEIILKAHNAGKIQALILRLANAIGTPAHKGVNAWNLVVNDLCRQAVEKRQMALLSSGNQERNFVSISYLTRTIQTLLERTMVNAKDGPLFNIGGPRNFTIWELAQKVQQRCSVVLKYDPHLTRPSNQREDQKSQGHFEFDCRQIESLAGHDSDALIDLEIDQTLRFCKNEAMGAST